MLVPMSASAGSSKLNFFHSPTNRGKLFLLNLGGDLDLIGPRTRENIFPISDNKWGGTSTIAAVDLNLEESSGALLSRLRYKLLDQVSGLLLQALEQLKLNTSPLPQPILRFLYSLDLSEGLSLTNLHSRILRSTLTNNEAENLLTALNITANKLFQAKGAESDILKTTHELATAFGDVYRQANQHRVERN